MWNIPKIKSILITTTTMNQIGKGRHVALLNLIQWFIVHGTTGKDGISFGIPIDIHRGRGLIRVSSHKDGHQGKLLVGVQTLCRQDDIVGTLRGRLFLGTSFVPVAVVSRFGIDCVDIVEFLSIGIHGTKGDSTIAIECDIVNGRLGWRTIVFIFVVLQDIKAWIGGTITDGSRVWILSRTVGTESLFKGTFRGNCNGPNTFFSFSLGRTSSSTIWIIGIWKVGLASRIGHVQILSGRRTIDWQFDIARSDLIRHAFVSVRNITGISIVNEQMCRVSGRYNLANLFKKSEPASSTGVNLIGILTIIVPVTFSIFIFFIQTTTVMQGLVAVSVHVSQIFHIAPFFAIVDAARQLTPTDFVFAAAAFAFGLDFGNRDTQTLSLIATRVHGTKRMDCSGKQEGGGKDELHICFGLYSVCILCVFDCVLVMYYRDVTNVIRDFAWVCSVGLQTISIGTAVAVSWISYFQN
mmetsp:Transcript_36842/g.89492  ORF Transcript_36842/g.89492 Transcript_36842/m.89492 type:complete len:466 (-) Transcript_36842:42-1439(-)